ncbi:hypothetical protein KUTeg_001394 [Tegillarca granosa]|uniref:C2H2-type domain-containing protein n=1 Tax=Tegillarca granosa TaxID=220873 RepID=A0ABQ9FR97_TEGGR|nr:hypothetical protein KUTeg_001394 [Tegillarca granosa]
MHGKRARAVGNNEKESSKEGKNKKGQMKLIAENTSNRGVYTSVLKLPWSRRTRNPKPESSQVNQSSGTTDQVQSPVVLVPVAATGIPNSQGGVFIPTTTWPVQSDSTAITTTSAQPMMMVYPNASFENFGKPVRKRGRPPKVPMIARLLADSAKKKKIDNFPIASFLPNIPTLQQPAIVLNVNNMVNTENIASAVNTVNANGQTSADQTSGQPTMSGDLTVNNLIPKIENQQALQNIAPMPSSNTMQGPLILPKETNPVNKADKVESIKTIKTEVVSDVTQQQISQPSVELKTMTTTTVANTASGALYQEMILSSKSLVSVKSRRRQTTTELLKSKSHSENFICTSFRLRPVKSGREKKAAAFVPGMRRRGRPPKRRLISSMFENTEIQLDNGETINTSEIREQGESNGNYVNNLIQNSDTNTLINQHNQMVSQDENVQTGIDSVYETQSEEFYSAQNNTNSETQEMISTRSFSSDESDNLSFSDMSESEEFNQNQRTYEKDEQKCGISEKDRKTNQEDSAMFQQLFHCRVCNEIIPVDKKEEHGAKHIKIKYSCNDCGSSYQVFLKDDNMEGLLCETCDKNVSNPSNKLETSVKVSSKSLICTECGQTFSDFSDYNHHIQSLHQSANISLDQHHVFNCPFCSTVFHSKTELKTHIKSHTNKIFHCPIENCGKSCITKERMKLHMKIKHQDVTFVRCGYEGCKKKFLNTLHLQEHVRFKHINVKGYKCSWPGCETEFTTERHLKVHLLMHTDEKPLKCDFCDYRCRQGNALNWHVRKHHPEACNQYSVSSGSPGSSTPADDAEEMEYTS